MAHRLVLHAQAKVNLTLEVLGKRADGFHEIRSVMQRITLTDELTVELSDELTLRCSDPSLGGPDNLVWRAAEVLRRECGVERGAAMRLQKSIPVAAGLGGGSSDCAAALRGLNQLWGLALSQPRLMEIGATLGSDVPFFLLETACALAEGRGERVTPLAPLPARWLVLVKPAVGISAGATYQALTRDGWSDGSRTAAWLAEVQTRRTVPAPFNALEAPALAVEPRARAARRALIDAGAVAPIMTGSGSTYIALFDTEGEADRVAWRVNGRAGEYVGLRVWAAGFVTL